MDKKFNPPTLPDAHTDDIAVDRFALAMKLKMAESRAKGRSGWEGCSPLDLSRMLREHVEKGDPRDVANFCMMLWAMEESIAATHEGPESLDAALKAECDEWCTRAADHLYELLKTRAERDALAAQVEALKIDAERYRWIRDKAWYVDAAKYAHELEVRYPGSDDYMGTDETDVENAIDAARAGKEEGRG